MVDFFFSLEAVSYGGGQGGSKLTRCIRLNVLSAACCRSESGQPLHHLCFFQPSQHKLRDVVAFWRFASHTPFMKELKRGFRG